MHRDQCSSKYKSTASPSQFMQVYPGNVHCHDTDIFNQRFKLDASVDQKWTDISLQTCS